MLAVQRINKCLDDSDAQETLEALKNPKAQLPEVEDDAAELYHEEFSVMRKEKAVSSAKLFETPEGRNKF